MEDNHTLVGAEEGEDGAGDGEGDSECCSADPQVRQAEQASWAAAPAAALGHSPAGLHCVRVRWALTCIPVAMAMAALAAELLARCCKAGWGWQAETSLQAAAPLYVSAVAPCGAALLEMHARTLSRLFLLHQAPQRTHAALAAVCVPWADSPPYHPYAVPTLQVSGASNTVPSGEASTHGQARARHRASPAAQLSVRI